MYYAGNHIWASNKMWPGTIGNIFVTADGKTIASGGSHAHDGITIDLTSEYKSYYLTFSVEASTEDDKHRGPFTNDQNYCFKFHGSVDKWDIDQVSC